MKYISKNETVVALLCGTCLCFSQDAIATANISDIVPAISGLDWLKYILKNVIVVVLLCTTTLCFSQDAMATLNIGDKAPPISGLDWLKGDPINSFQSGHIYVIEFGYIGCPGCTQSIPHMSEIAEKFKGQVTLISVFYNEKKARMPRFLDSWGDRIKYTVAIDEESKKTMQNAWLKPAAINYAPAAFIINRDGKIVWIGNPGKGFGIDEALQAILNGEDLKNIRMKSYLQEGFSYAAFSAFEKKDLEVSVLLAERAIRENPEYTPPYVAKLDFLFVMDERAAYKYAQELLVGRFANDHIFLHRIISDKIILSYELKKIANPDWDLVIRLNERAIKINPYPMDSFLMYKSIAQAYVNKGDLKKAIQILESTISMLRNSGFNKEEMFYLDNHLVEYLQLVRKMEISKSQTQN
jgi:tetratricopeptide (TPR) repeat protein